MVSIFAHLAALHVPSQREVWQNVSPEAIDLIRKLLQPEVEERRVLHSLVVEPRGRFQRWSRLVWEFLFAGFSLTWVVLPQLFLEGFLS